MADSNINVTFTNAGLSSLEAALVNGTINQISRYDIAPMQDSEFDPNADWPPISTGWYQVDNPVSTGEISIYITPDPATGVNTIVIDLYLGPKVPAAVTYESITSGGSGYGWVDPVSPLAIGTTLQLGWYAIWITNSSNEQIVLLTGEIIDPITGDPSSVYKYSTTLGITGNAIEFLNNFELTNPPQELINNLTYVVGVNPQATVVNKNNINTLPIPDSGTTNSYILADKYNTLATTNGINWSFSNQQLITTSLAITQVSSTTYSCPALAAWLPSSICANSNTITFNDGDIILGYNSGANAGLFVWGTSYNLNTGILTVDTSSTVTDSPTITLYLSYPIVNSPTTLLYLINNTVTSNITLPNNVFLNSSSTPFQVIFKFTENSTLKKMPITIPSGQTVEGQSSYSVVGNSLDSYTFTPNFVGGIVNWQIT